jgi:hypothetical protein
VPSCGTNSGSDRSNWRPRSANSSPRPFSRRRADQSRSRRLGSSAVGPSALTVRTSARSRRRNPLPFSDAPGRAIDIEAGRWAARPTCHGSPARPRACASLAVDRPIGPSLPQRANVSPACPASSTRSKLGAKPATVAGREGPTTGRGPRVLAECPASVINNLAIQLRLPCPIQSSLDRKRTHSPCYIPTTKSGAAPRRPPPQFPSPK